MKINYPTIQLSSYPTFRPGQLYLILLIFLFVMTLFLTGLHSRLGYYIGFSRNSLVTDQATALADGGVDLSVNKINANPGYPGDETLTLQTGQVKIYPVQDLGSSKRVTSEGCIPNCTQLTATKRKAIVEIAKESVPISFPYPVHGTNSASGVNSINLNSSIVDGYGAPSYSNSNILCTGAITLISKATWVGTMSPISCSNDRTNPAPVVNGPTLDLTPWKQIAEVNTINCSDPGAVCNFTAGTYNIGPQKFIGNVTIGTFVFLYVTGPIYIDGNLNATAPGGIFASQVHLNESFGSCGTLIIAKTIHLSAGTYIWKTSTTPAGRLLFVATEGVDPAIEDDYFFNQRKEAIYYANNTNGNGVIDMEGTLGGGSVPVTHLDGAVVGGIVRTNQMHINYQTELANAKFCGSNKWVVKRGTYKLSK